MTNSPKRSLIKSITWRIVASLTTGLIGLMVTGDLAIAGGIMTVDFFAKFVLYYLHERLWDKWRF
jgi:uncharacterized membrane protein